MNKEVTQNRVFLRTYGCQMNEYDSELVVSILTSNGYVFVNSEKEASIVLLNTCSVRDNAHRKVFGHIHEIKHRLKGKNVKIGVLGCMASAMKEELLNDRNLNLDFIVGPDSYKKLPGIIEESFKKGDRPLKGSGSKPHNFDLSEFETYSDINPTREDGVNAWLAIMRGCNNFCSFCIVPYTRGRERSRSPESILKETKKLVSDGYKQVTLLGQNVNSYTYENIHFAELIEKVSQVDGIERVRFTSPHPKDFPEELIDAMAADPKICNHIHLPLQAGNNRILKIMNRTYTKQEFIDLVNKIRTKLPEISITTDIIIGFPTETDKEFQDTVDVMKIIEFDSAFIFKYSVRQGTTAAHNYPDDVPEKIKTERIVLLNQIQKDISLKKNRAHIGQLLPTLIEENDKDNKSVIRGKTEGNKTVLISSSDCTIGDIITVEITSATPHLLQGSIL